MVLSSWIVVLGLCLQWPTTGADIFDRMMPAMLPRAEELRKALVPVPDDMLEEVTFHMGSYYIPLDAESQPCRNHSAALFDSFLAEELWAIKFVDASSKIPSGMMDGHVMDLGNYDQCLSAVAPGGVYKGKHCSFETKGLFPAMDAMNSELAETFLPALRMDALLSLCVPSSCSARDVKTHLDTALAAANASIIIYDYSCSSIDSAPFTLLDWTVTLLLVGLASLIIYSTVHDIKSAEIEKNQLLVCFSLRANIRRMMDTTRHAVDITCLNGLRVLAISWIMICHRLLFMLNFPNVRLKKVAENVLTLLWAPIQSAQLSVEVFFLMSGILMSYSYLRYRSKGHNINLLAINILRYIRMTPAYALIVLLYVSLLVRVSDGPLWGRTFVPFKEQCQRTWWASLLYINNYYAPFDICAPHAWYIMSDYQLHVVLSPLLVLLYKRPRLGLSLVGACLVLTTTAAISNAYRQGLRAGGPVSMNRNKEQNVLKDYIVTHLRATSFLIGMAVGFLLFKIKQGEVKIKPSKLALLAGWLLSVFMILFSIFFGNLFDQEEHVYSPVWDTLFLVFHRHIFSLGLSWIIVVCTLDYGGCVNRFLSWRGFTPLARLTFCIYLTHVIVQNIHTGSMRTNITFNAIQTYYFFIADFVVSLATAAILFLAVEAPVISITNTVLKAKLMKPVAPEPDTQLPVFKTVGTS